MSEKILISQEYVLVIDTDSPSFSFYRQLCAYCTGYDYEGFSTVEYSDKFCKDLKIDEEDESANPFYDFLELKPDESGNLACSCIWLNPRYGQNGSGECKIIDESNYEHYDRVAPLSVGFLFSQKPTKQHICLIEERTKDFFDAIFAEADTKIAFEGVRLVCHTRYAEEILLD